MKEPNEIAVPGLESETEAACAARSAVVVVVVTLEKARAKTAVASTATLVLARALRFADGLAGLNAALELVLEDFEIVLLRRDCQLVLRTKVDRRGQIFPSVIHPLIAVVITTVVRKFEVDDV